MLFRSFVYLPESPYRQVDLDRTGREVIDEESFQENGGKGAAPASYLHTAEIENVHQNTTAAFRMTGLTGNPKELALYARDGEGKFSQVDEELWTLEGAGDTLQAGQVYEVFFTCEDGGAYDLEPEERGIKMSVLMAYKN